jgi:hypothetical protein
MALPDQSASAHLYVSTACQHGQHDRCRQQCKFCAAPCLCPCHKRMVAITGIRALSGNPVPDEEKGER